MSPNARQRFLASLHRCDEIDDFVDRFYQRFIAASPEVRRKFADTDLPAQVRVLRRSLELCAAAADGEREGLNELTMRARTHDHAHLDIRPALYDLWLEALLETAAECDTEWDEDVDRAWRNVLGFVVGFMTARY